MSALCKACRYSLSGLKIVLTERAFRQELLLGAIMLIVELFRSTTTSMKLYLFSAYFLVLIMECINSAIETTIDRIGLENHPLSKQAKDIGSAAVFLAILHLSVVWLLGYL
ncbi:MAG: diacylglycerol kinase [Holosporales bacterium]|nr:diacylglycerol kinase [Holosporales bacterium]